jgi:hypothetical protein
VGRPRRQKGRVSHHLRGMDKGAKTIFRG